MSDAVTVSPRIFRSGRISKVRMTSPEGGSWTGSIVPMSGTTDSYRPSGGMPVEFSVVDGVLEAEILLETEQEYVLAVRPSGAGEDTPFLEFRLYALNDDLFPLTPYKGDLHMHSDRSDGREHPAVVAAACRRIGMDFIAITDHWLYRPSIEAIEAFAGFATEMLMVPGEEVHPPENPIHIVNFGGRESVNALFTADSYRAGVEAVTEELRAAGTGSGISDLYPLASAIWTFRRIREAGGIGIFCHPYWYTRRRYDIPETLVTAVMAGREYDALELIGGYHLFEAESNLLQVIRYCEDRAAGLEIPIVGTSDSHGVERGELFGWYHTVLLSRSLDLDGIAEAVRSFRSTAVEALPGRDPRSYGPFRMVRYTQFLIREYFPLHDPLCAAEGAAMAEYYAGTKTAPGKTSSTDITGCLRRLMWDNA